MKITALDIRKQEFARTFRGYDPDEVDSFMQVIATGWQEMVDDLRRSQEKIDEQRMKLEHYMKVEEALEEALQTARSSARQTIDSAEKKASNMLEDAENRIVDLQKEADANRLEIKRETARYAVRQQEIVAKLRAFLVSEMEMLRHFEADTGERTLAQPTARREIEMFREEPDAADDEDPAHPDDAAPDQADAEAREASQASDESDEMEAESSQSSDEMGPTDVPASEMDDHPPQTEAVSDEEEWEEEDEEDEEEWESEDEWDDSESSNSEDGADDTHEYEEDEPGETSPGWTVTPVFESASDGTDQDASQGSQGLPDDSADDEIKKIHEILKGLDEEQDNEEA